MSSGLGRPSGSWRGIEEAGEVLGVPRHALSRVAPRVHRLEHPLAQTRSLVAYTEMRLRFPSYVRRGFRVKAKFAIIHPNIVAARNGYLRISTKPRLYSFVKLNPSDRRQSLLLEQAEKGVWRIGQVLLTGEWALIPLLKEIELLEAIDPVLSDIARAL